MANRDSDDWVPYFSSDRWQIVFEFFFLLLSLAIAVAFVAVVHLKGTAFALDRNTKALMLAAAGGFLGGWAFDAKWFYRVTARGKSDQYPYRWQRHKFYWRILTPFLAGLGAFAVYLLASSKVLPIVVADAGSGRAAFGISFFLGYFSDMVFSRLAAWTERLLPKGKPS